ncbi:hypothetical protein [Promineifilum sp.]|uniref:InlB B-repeat-containing protein n=1 Tax=Promineifilum sp. TaxID=2664178 RepID=UPI0035AF1662
MPRKSFVALFALALALSVIAAGVGLSSAQSETENQRTLVPEMVQPRDGAANPLSPQSPNTIWMSEGFEGTWPSSGWTLLDQSDTDGGLYFFGKRNCRPLNGSFAAWAGGGGSAGSQLGCNDNYVNNLDTWAEFGPFDLSGATEAHLGWSMIGIAEFQADCNFDGLFIGASTNGSDYSGGSICTDLNSAYGEWELDLTALAGQSQVWIAFQMYSDDSQTARGYTIDNVFLDVTVPGCETPGALSLSAPGNASSTADTTPTFSWSAAGNATEYQLMVDNNNDFSSPVINLLRGGTQYTHGAALAAGTYYWGVRGHNTAGGCDVYGPWTNAWSFTITGAPTCYQLTLDHTGSGGNPTASPAASTGCANGRYTAGQAISLTASPASGWRVNSWQGTNNNGSTSVSNTATMPAGNHTVRVNYVQGTTTASRAFLPSIHYGLVGWVGPFEIEPNNDIAQANGPMVIGRAYQAYPNDRFDYFYFELGQQRTVVVTMTNNVVVQPQLQLTPPNAAPVSDTVGPEFKIVYPNAAPGRYYIRTAAVNNTSTTVAYTLQVTTQ